MPFLAVILASVLFCVHDVTHAQLTEAEIEIFRSNGVTVSDFVGDSNYWSFEHNGKSLSLTIASDVTCTLASFFETLTYFKSNHNTNTRAHCIFFNLSGIPEHETGTFPNDDNPNELLEQQHEYIIPKTPTSTTGTNCLTYGTSTYSVTELYCCTFLLTLLHL